MVLLCEFDPNSRAARHGQSTGHCAGHAACGTLAVPFENGFHGGSTMAEFHTSDAHFERYREEYAKQLDEKYRAMRRPARHGAHAPWRQAPDGTEHHDSALEGLGRALSAPVLGATDEPAVDNQPNREDIPVSGRIA
jgi:hypothetical protein